MIVAAGVVLLGCSAWAIGAAQPADASLAGLESTARPTPRQSPHPVTVPTPTPTPTFDKRANSISDPSSIWIVVNKSLPLDPPTYVPPDLVEPPVPNVHDQPVRQEVSTALSAMFAAARSEAGLALRVQSGYREYDMQANDYAGDVAAHGQTFADADTARAGYSEHQTGLAVDLSATSGDCVLNACFGQLPEGEWLAANAWRFGFLLRYPQGKEAVTGFAYEPWHFRYIGVPLATELHSTGTTTLEEFFGVPGGEAYSG